ncbi:hypothetical protein AMS68_001208 [Peltaster fructicola]|uniref:F-box domain-containing protein n=1 Tax=Peltaster fructicola TaxID=286661 RepID=A0A6H0XM25_9PEZI|nr:hypothetical protein AMS68_001208 [Peltaster fructicola]
MASERTTLPPDVLHLLCDELSARNDFSSLYNCLVSSRQIAASGAINALYRISHECFGRANPEGEPVEDAPAAEARQITQKNSILWRTIIMSALGQTSYPYYKHLRVLDLRDLSNMLQDDTFRSAQMYDYFFSGPLAPFMITVKATRSKQLVDQLKIKDTVAAIGDVIVDQAHLLEALTEHAIETVFSMRLQRWLPKLQNLRRLDVGDGRVLADESLRSLIHKHCLNFSELRIFSFADDAADTHLAALIGGLPENTIVLFENISDCKINTLTCSALNKHGKSLRTLSLALMDDGLLALAKLSDCTRLTTFAIDWLRQTPGLYTSKKDACEEIAEWLKGCNTLSDVTLKNISFAPELLSPLLRGSQASLTSLTLTATESALYDIRSQSEFHNLLGQQRELNELILAANADDASFEDRAVMLTALCNLKSLRKLRVTRLADDFVGADLQELTDHLTNLEDLYIGGIGYTDDNLQSLGKLPRLRNLVVAGLSRFTADGLLDFVLNLGDGNHGLSLQIDLADFDYAIRDEQQVLISETLAARVAGVFRYALSRDPNIPEYDSSDSD